MKQKISGFHQDIESHWVADLSCGHKQHVRHDPPWMEREWVLSSSGRDSRLGEELDCKHCEDLAQKIIHACYEILKNKYEEAGMSGLCGEGRWEVALESLKSLKTEDIKDIKLLP